MRYGSVTFQNVFPQAQYLVIQSCYPVSHRKPLLNILMQPLCGPSTETHSYGRLHTVTQSDNHVKVVVFYLTLNLSFALLSN